MEVPRPRRAARLVVLSVLAACRPQGPRDDPPRAARGPAAPAEAPEPEPDVPPPDPGPPRLPAVAGQDLRTGEATCALCVGDVPRIVALGRPDDPAFVELARDADAVAAKYAPRLEARIVALGPDPTPAAGGTGGPTAPPAWVTRLRVVAPVVRPTEPIELPADFAPLARGTPPAVLLVLPGGTIAYGAAGPEDLADLHDAFLAARSGTAGAAADP